MQYNRAQLQAVQHTDGPILVLSGAGTGKTRVVVGRIAHLIETGVAPCGILAITFTRKAAEEMRQRLLASGTPGAESVTVSTFHALCLRLLKQYARQAALPPDFSVMDESVRSRILSAILKEHTTNPVPFILVNYDPEYTIKEGGRLCDIVPTLLDVMGLEQPSEMTGESLLIKK